MSFWLVLATVAVVVGSFVWWRRRLVALAKTTCVQYWPSRGEGSEGDGAPESVDSSEGQDSVRGLQRLDSLGDIYCCTVTVIGPAGQGKSFLLNCLRKRDIFRVRRHPLRSATTGICFSEPFAVDEMSVCGNVIATGTTRVGAALRGGSRLVTLVDTEGLGARGSLSDDTRMVSALLVISRIVIFNWMGGVQKDSILNQLGMFATRAKAQVQGPRRRKCLGCLHVVLRDIALSPDDEDRLNDELFTSETDETNDAIKQRNVVRSVIVENFESVNVWGLPAPNAAPSDMFSTKIDRLRADIVRQIRRSTESPRAGTRMMTGRVIARCLPELLRAEAEPEPETEIPQQPSSPCGTFEKLTIRAAVSAYTVGMQQFVGQLKGSCPLSYVELRNRVRAKDAELKLELERNLVAVCDSRCVWSEVGKVYEDMLAKAREENTAAVTAEEARLRVSSRGHVIDWICEEIKASGRCDQTRLREFVRNECETLKDCVWMTEIYKKKFDGSLTAFAEHQAETLSSVIDKASDAFSKEQVKLLIEERRRAEMARAADRSADEETILKHRRESCRLRDDKQVLEEKIEELLAEADDLNQQICDLNTEMEELVSHKTQLEMMTRNLQTQNEGQSQEIDELKRVVQGHKQIAGGLIRKVQTLEIELGTCKAKKAEQFRFLSQNIQNLSAGLEADRQHHLDSESKFQERIDRLFSEKCELESKTVKIEQKSVTTVKAYQEDIDKLKVQISRYRDSNAKMTEQTAQLRDSIQKMKTDFRERERKLEGKSERLEKTLQEQKCQAEEAQNAAKREAEENSSRWEKEKEELTKELALQREGNRNLVAQIGEMKKCALELEEQLGGHMPVWEWEAGPADWRCYDESIARKLESSYRDRKQTVEIKVKFGRRDTLCEVSDLEVPLVMKQKTPSTPSRDNLILANVRVRRTVVQKRAIPTPRDWGLRQEETALAIKPLAHDCDDFDNILRRMRASLPKARIHTIDRIEHWWLWREFSLAKQRMKARNGNDAVGEKELFHGSGQIHPSKIYGSEQTKSLGFSLESANAGVWGKGCYFAEKASFSHEYAHGSGKKQIFLANVLTGVSQDGDRDEERTGTELRPVDAGSSRGEYRYDSVKGVGDGSDVYVVFETVFAYPTYLITYSIPSVSSS